MRNALVWSRWSRAGCFVALLAAPACRDRQTTAGARATIPAERGVDGAARTTLTDADPVSMRPDAWARTRSYSGAEFTFDYPISATVQMRGPNETAPGYLLVTDLPECPHHCDLRVTVEADTIGAGLDAWVLRATTPDVAPGASADSDAQEDLPVVLDTLLVGGERAVLLENQCGDCTSRALVLERGRRVATMTFSIDDRETNSDALEAYLLAVTRTFRWRP